MNTHNASNVLSDLFRASVDVITRAKRTKQPTPNIFETDVVTVVDAKHAVINNHSYTLKQLRNALYYILAFAGGGLIGNFVYKCSTKTRINGPHVIGVDGTANGLFDNQFDREYELYVDPEEDLYASPKIELSMDSQNTLDNDLDETPNDDDYNFLQDHVRNLTNPDSKLMFIIYSCIEDLKIQDIILHIGMSLKALIEKFPKMISTLLSKKWHRNKPDSIEMQQVRGSRMYHDNAYIL